MFFLLKFFVYVYVIIFKVILVRRCREMIRLVRDRGYVFLGKVYVRF